MERTTTYHLILWLQMALVLLLPNISMAQEQPTKKLEEVIIKENRLSEFAIGARTTNFDSSVISANETTSLATLLNDYSTIHIKSHGSGMLSSISFRGTGPEHTAVLWHGVNISYPMLGQSDFSLLPIALNDQVNIQHGTGSSLYGTGALGGTIALNSSTPKNGFGVSITQWLGSFETLKNTANLSYAKDKFFIKINSFWDKSANDFSYRNTSKIGEPIESQQNAAFSLFGVGMESGVKAGDKNQLLVSAQVFKADRQLQPSMNASSIADEQLDETIRIRTRYQFNGLKTGWHLQYAYLDDEITYNGARTKSRQHVFRGELDQQLTKMIKGSVAIDHSLVDVSGQFYSGRDVAEYRTNLWASALVSPKPWVSLSGNIRQAFHPTYTVPLSPSIGAEFFIRESSQSNHTLSSMFARGFRIPTLNELYWEPGGNLALEPEDSYSIEVGYKAVFKKNMAFEYDITTYRMWVNNWILWYPFGSFWSPQNIKEVDVYGIEFSGSVTHSIDKVALKWMGNYAYTKSINREGIDNFDRSVGKQLSYTPIHKGGITMTSNWARWNVLVNGVIIGERFITADNEDSLPAYMLLNLRASRSFELYDYGISFHATVNNVLNTHYQSVANKAMPGINYLIGINLNFNKPE